MATGPLTISVETRGTRRATERLRSAKRLADQLGVTVPMWYVALVVRRVQVRVGRGKWRPLKLKATVDKEIG